MIRASTHVYHIRPYLPGDEAALVRLIRVAGLAVFPNDPVKDIARIIATPSAQLFVLEMGRKLVGLTAASCDGRYGWIYYVAVDPSYQKHGYGQILMNYAEDWLLRRGVTKVLLLIRHDNERVTKFYEHMGYSSEACVCMGKFLPGDLEESSPRH